MTDSRLSLEDVGRILAGLKSGEALDRLDALYNRAAASRPAVAEQKGDQDGRMTVTAESVSPSGTLFERERKALGIPEDHPNVLYVDVLMTHAGRVMNNYGQDIISREEMEKALPTMLFQPIDVAESMTHHERERNTWVNGIRGFVYAAKMVDVPDNADEAELWCGAIIWARDFPEIAARIVQERVILGASWDLLFSGFSTNADNTRNLSQITFLGGALLYKSRAADSDTRLGDISYLGKDPSDIDAYAGASAGGTDANQEGAAPEKDKHMNDKTDKDPAILEEVKNALSEMRAQFETAAQKNTDLEQKVRELTDSLKKAEAERDEAVARIQAAEAEARAAELAGSRMRELEAAGPFADEAEKAEAGKDLGTISDEEFAARLADHKAAVAQRAVESLKAELEAAKKLLAENGLSEAATVHNADDNPENPPATTGGPNTVHNAQESMAQARSLGRTAAGMASINGRGGASIDIPDASRPRSLGKVAAKLARAR